MKSKVAMPAILYFMCFYVVLGPGQPYLMHDLVGQPCPWQGAETR